MKLGKLIQEMRLLILNKTNVDDDIEINNGYASDLLSQVMAKAEDGSIWLTTQSHGNIIGVANMTGIKAIVVCEGHEVPEEVISAADQEGIVILKSDEGIFSLAGKLYAQGVR